MTHASEYVVPPSSLPVRASIGLFCLALGFINLLHEHDWGKYLMIIGATFLLYTVFRWFALVISDTLKGRTASPKMESSFRWGMIWFIFTEVMFFATFFGALFYLRVYTIPYLDGSAGSPLTHYLLWPGFQGEWPLLQTPNPAQFLGPTSVINAWGIPLVNTCILLLSGVTITFAHWGIIAHRKWQAVVSQCATIALGISFLFLQAHEYIEAYTENGLRLDSGAYGNTFFMLTGFHGLHVTLGTLMLIVILGRIICNHFQGEDHFAFEAVAWYWHFVDVVWLLLFVFVYWL